MTDQHPATEDPPSRFVTRAQQTAGLVQELHAIISALENAHQRPFTPDGHLVGSLAEAAAEEIFCLQLMPPSTTGYDARSCDGRTVEIKGTYKNAVSLRPTSKEVADLLLVLKLDKDQPPRVVYNGPYKAACALAGSQQSNGQMRLSFKKLNSLSREQLSEQDRVPERHDPPRLGCTR